MVNQIKNNLSQVQQGNLAALNETTEILHTSAIDVKHSTTNVVLIVGALCSLAIMLIFTFLLRAIVIK